MNAKREQNTQKANVARIIARPGHRVKARIIGAGLRMADVARAANLSQSSLSNYMAGRVRNPYVQVRIVIAFCELTKQTITVREFWGDLAPKVSCQARSDGTFRW